MKFSRRSFLLLFVTIIAQSPSILQGHIIQPPPHSSIPEITQAADLTTLLTSNDPTIILGYMNHCPHCNKLLKYFETLPAKYPKINFLTVNGPRLKLHEQVAKYKKDKDSYFRIPGYPSIVFVKNGKPVNVQVGGNEKTLDENIKKLISKH